MSEFSHSQLQRLNHIDFRLYFTGQVSRADLIQRFDLSEAAASRDLRVYREYAQENSDFDPVSKSYVATEHFKPTFIADQDARTLLRALVHGVGDDFCAPNEPLIPCELPLRLQAPRIETLATVSRAIFQRRVLRICYQSSSGSNHVREVVPFALGGNGLRWHVRAFDRSQDRFADFVVNRIEEAVILGRETIKPNETKESDDQWNRMVELEIVPHPTIGNQKMIELEYGMIEGVITYKSRAALVGYILRLWHVDCSKDASLRGGQYQLWLRNRATLYGVKNLEIAPGYQPD